MYIYIYIYVCMYIPMHASLLYNQTDQYNYTTVQVAIGPVPPACGSSEFKRVDII